MTGKRMYELKGAWYWFFCDWKPSKRKSKVRKAHAKWMKKYYRQQWKRDLVRDDI